MSGHRPFGELTKDWPAKRRLRVEKRKDELMRENVVATMADEIA